MTTEGVLSRRGAGMVGALCLVVVSGHLAHAADPNAQAAAPPAPAAAPAATPAPAAPAAPAPAAPGAPGSGAVASSAGQSSVRLRDLERRVNELKEQIFRSKARLNLLKETVLHGVIAGARAVITHRNEMGSMYEPISYVYSLDGNQIYPVGSEPAKLDQKEFEIYNGSLTPGNHTLSVQLVYQGN